MKKRYLGTQADCISEIGLGCMGMSEFYGSRDDAESIKVIHKAIDLGITFFDTADMYGSGDNEVLVGTALKEKRDKIILATKFGFVRTEDKNSRGINGSPEYVRSACEASLKRLNTDYIDLYYLHRVDPNVPIQETVGAMAQLVKEGKIRHIGLSEASIETMEKAIAVHPISALQTEYSLWTRDPEDGIIGFCAKHEISFVAYSPLGRGFLSGQIKKLTDLEATDYRRSSPRYQGENFQKNLSLVSVIESLARDKGCTPSQLALAWVLSRGEHIIPIPGTKRLKYLEENIGAAEIVLDDDDKSKIDEMLPPDIAAGMRYTEGGMKFVNN